MHEVATQPQAHPLLQKDGYLFHRLAVDLVPAADGSKYEVLFLLASVNGTSLCLCLFVCLFVYLFCMYYNL